MLLTLFLLIAFVLGSIPFSFVIGKRVRGIDLREHGSGNLGATNVFRTLGPNWGSLCLFLDMAKGAAAVLLMTLAIAIRSDGDTIPFHISPDLFRIFAGFLAAVGHTFSPFVNFHGGKGVATTAGAFAVLAPYAIIAAVVVFLAVFFTTRIVSLASIAAASVLPFAVTWFELRSERVSSTIIVFVTIVCAWVIYRHRGNIARIRAGTEAKVGDNGKTEVFPRGGADEPDRKDQG